MDCWLWEVKRVTVDLGAEITSALSAAHSATFSEWVARALAAVGTWWLEKESLKSSA